MTTETTAAPPVVAPPSPLETLSALIADDVEDVLLEGAEPTDDGELLQSVCDPDTGFATCGYDAPETQAAKTNGSEMYADFVIVTRTKEPNRYNRYVQLKAGPLGEGLITTFHQQNPVVLWDHGFGGYPFPIGLAQSPDGQYMMSIGKSKVASRCYFSQSQPFAQEVFALVDEKILRMSSIGFNPRMIAKAKGIKPRIDDPNVLDLTAQDWTIDVTEAELMEWSITPIGADRGALKQSIDRRALGGNKLNPQFRAVMQRWLGDAKKPAVGIGFDAASLKNPIDPPPVTLSQSAPLQVTTTATPVEIAVPETVVQAAEPVVATPVLDPKVLIAAFEQRQRAKQNEAMHAAILQRFGDKLAEQLNPLHQKLEQFDQKLTNVTGEAA